MLLALRQADASWVLQPPGLKWDLAATLAGVSSARVCTDTATMIAEVVRESRPGDAIVIMSNGDFHNLRAELPIALGQPGR